MKEITRKKFIGGMAATVALGWRGGVHEEARVVPVVDVVEDAGELVSACNSVYR